jgi:hypothetical protein
VFVYSSFIEKPRIDPEVTNPSFLRWFYHSSLGLQPPVSHVLICRP